MDEYGPGLQFLDKRGRVRALIGMQQDALAIRLWNEQGRARAGLSLEPDGVFLFALDPTGKLSEESNAIRTGAGLPYPRYNRIPWPPSIYWPPEFSGIHAGS